ncbi:MAG TPA: RnfABCDGE type electron transport complex subunit D [Gammaproteobacteria bacterium]|nr:RnfABCDGE type electron transport complex subunit D [Gammaproteobacteria bacterium]
MSAETARFGVKTAPHSPPKHAVPVIMRRVLYALVPAAACYVWFFGFGLVINFLVCAAASVLAEAAMLRIRGRPIQPALGDGSAVVTAALLAFSMPPLVPWWVPAAGGVSAIVLAKQLYGGLGKNLFNPAMVGYAILLLSFPVEMTRWVPPRMGDIDYVHLEPLAHLAYAFTGTLPPELGLDAMTRATPLDLVKEGLRSGQTFTEIRANSLFGDFGGRGWEWVGNFLILGGLYLLSAGIIRWHIPIAMLAGLVIPSGLLFAFDPAGYAGPGFHLFSGAALLGAFFIATDPVSAAATIRGRLIYGCSIGFLTFAIRTWGGYPDGVAFAVLIMNAAVPLIDRYTRPRVFGHG